MIRFPGLHLFISVEPIAFTVFGIPIYWYAICIVCAIAVAVLLCLFQKDKFGIDNDFLLGSLLMALILGFIGARLYYVAFHWDEYRYHLGKILNLRDGGLAIYGGILLGGFAIFCRCRKQHVNALDVFDRIAPFVALAQSIGRWGNFFNQEAYGKTTTNFLRMGIDTYKGYLEVHPTFLYESIATFLIFCILMNMQKQRKFKGQIVSFYLFLYAGIRMLIEPLRMDSLMLGNWRISQILSMAIFVVFGIILLKKFTKHRTVRHVA